MNRIGATYHKKLRKKIYMAYNLWKTKGSDLHKTAAAYSQKSLSIFTSITFLFTNVTCRFTRSACLFR